MEGEPGLRKYVHSNPSISADGSTIAYVLTDYDYGPSTGDHWQGRRQRLIYARVRSGVVVEGGDVLEVVLEDVFGSGIRSIQLSGDGHHIAFYAGGIIRSRSPVSNLEMPPYEPVRDSDRTAPTCNVYCFKLTLPSPHGSQYLHVMPDPDRSSQPMVVAHPKTSNINSYNMATVLHTPPSLSENGSRLLFHAGFDWGSSQSGVYLSETRGMPSTSRVISFGTVPGYGTGEETLTTGAGPAISPDGEWMGYYLRDVVFPPGYSDSEHYEEVDTYCPRVLKDEVAIVNIASTETSTIIEASSSGFIPILTTHFMLAVARQANSLSFVSRAESLDNLDRSHEVFYAAMIGGGTPSPFPFFMWMTDLAQCFTRQFRRIFKLLILKDYSISMQ